MSQCQNCADPKAPTRLRWVCLGGFNNKVFYLCDKCRRTYNEQGRFLESLPGLQALLTDALYE